MQTVVPSDDAELAAVVRTVEHQAEERRAGVGSSKTYFKPVELFVKFCIRQNGFQHIRVYDTGLIHHRTALVLTSLSVFAHYNTK